MNISDAAVEAAAMAIYQNRTGMDWESRSEVLKATVRGEARAALEAAAPHLMAAAFENGYRKACADIIATKPTAGPRPYRKAPGA